MRVDVGIYAARIVLKIAAVALGEPCGHALGCGPHLQYALHAIMLDQVFAQKLGQLASGHAARHIHLPETVLRGDVALRFKEIVEVCGFNMGHAMLISTHVDGGREPGQEHLPIELRQRIAHGVFKPPGRAKYTNNQSDDYKSDKAKEQTQNRMPALLFQFHTSAESHVEDIVSSVTTGLHKRELFGELEDADLDEFRDGEVVK